MNIFPCHLGAIQIRETEKKEIIANLFIKEMFDICFLGAVILSYLYVFVTRRGGTLAAIGHMLWSYVIRTMKEMHKGLDSTRQEAFLEEMMFEQVFIKHQ